MHRPLRGGVGAVEGVFELDNGAVLVLQDAILRRVVLHQLRQGGKLLPAIQVVEVSRILDPDVRHLLAHPETKEPLGRKQLTIKVLLDGKTNNFQMTTKRTSLSQEFLAIKV